MDQTIELSVRGVDVVYKLVQHSSGSVVMEPEPASTQEMRHGRVKRVDYNTEDQTVQYFAAKGVKVGEYQRDKDPDVFIYDWRLNNVPFVKDQYVDGGGKISDWSYFTMQSQSLHRSCVWGLINVLKLKHKKAMEYATKATEALAKDVLNFRGVDITQPQTAEDVQADKEISQRESTRNFYDLTRKVF